LYTFLSHPYAQDIGQVGMALQAGRRHPLAAESRVLCMIIMLDKTRLTPIKLHEVCSTGIRVC
jgi:hypothetical protein